MEYARRFKVLVCAPSFNEADLEGARLRDILTQVEAMGYAVTRARDDDDAELVVRTDAAIGCIVVDWGKKGLQGKMAALISLVRKRGLDMTSVFNWVPWCPAMSVPAGLSQDGLPIGMHVTAPPQREDLALRAASAIEKAWPHVWPNDWAPDPNGMRF